jgi:hypothetical protein
MLDKKIRWVSFVCIFIIALFSNSRIPVLAHNMDKSLDIPSEISTTATHNKIIIKWDKIIDARSYEIEIGGQIIDNGKFTNYIHKDLQSGTAYTYRIRAKKNGKYGGWSRHVTQITANPVYKTIDHWKYKKELMLSRHGVEVVAVNDMLYAVGGYGESYCNTIEEYNPLTDSWRFITTIPTTRYAPSVVVNEDNIYIIGGYDKEKGALKTIDVYNIKDDRWTTISDKITPASHFTSIVVDNKIYSIGGYNEKDGILSTVEQYDFITNSWSKKKDMPTPRSRCSSVVVDGKVYVLGGYDGDALGIIEVYNPLTDGWEQKGYMPIPRYGMSSINIYNKIYILGGYNTTAFDIVEEYDPQNNTFTIQKFMSKERFDFGVIVIKDLLYVVGGTNDAYALDNVEQASFIKPDPPKNFTMTPEEKRIKLEWNKEEEYITYEVELNGEIIDNKFENIYYHENIEKNFQHTYRIRSKHYTTSRWTDIRSYILWEHNTPAVCLSVENWFTVKEWMEAKEDAKQSEILLRANNMDSFYTIFIRIEYDPNKIEIVEDSIISPVLGNEQSKYIIHANNSQKGILNLMVSKTGEVQGVDGKFNLVSFKVKYKSFSPSKFLVTKIQLVNEDGFFISIPNINNNKLRILEE